MNLVELAFVLVVLLVIFVALGRRGNVPYPVILVLGGLLLGCVPGVPRPHLRPETALGLFLPPLLYWEAVSAPTHAMRRNARWLVSLALGLVFVTAWAVALTLHALVGGANIAIALVLGAILAPTDSVAPAAIAQRLGVPRNVVAIVQGESLLNDAAALALYGAALAAVASGTLTPGVAMLHFFLGALGALVIGLGVGWVATFAWRHVDDPELESLVSIVLPFAAYVPATRLGLSGVLAVVSAGLYVNRYIPVVMTPIGRLRSYGYWETLVFVTNAVVFIFVGLEVRDAIAALHNYRIGIVVAAIVLVNVVVIAVRFLWVYGTERVIELLPRARASRLDRKERLVVAWSGLRGGVSLAIALSIPAALPGGEPFPFRHLLILVTFSVILCTLVGGGLTLPYVIRAIGLRADDSDEKDERVALGAMSTAALTTVERLERSGDVSAEQAGAMRARYEERRRRAGDETGALDGAARDLAAREHEVYEAERRVLVALRDDGRIDTSVQRKLQLAVDLTEAGALIARGVEPDAVPPVPARATCAPAEASRPAAATETGSD